jgi:hypothetical protein
LLANIAGLATNGADTRAEAFAGIISFTVRDRNPVVGRNLKVEPAKVFGEWIRRWRGIDVIVGDDSVYVLSWCIGSWEVLLDSGSNWIEPGGGNLIAVVVFIGKRRPMHHTAYNCRGLRVIDSRKPGEISAEDGSSRNRIKRRLIATVLDDLVEVEVEEELLLEDRTADGAAEVVIAEARLLRRAPEIIAIGIQRIVLKILVCRTVEVVRTTLADLIVENTPTPYCAEKAEELT